MVPAKFFLLLATAVSPVLGWDANVHSSTQLDFTGYRVVRSIVSEEQYHQILETEDLWNAEPSHEYPGSAKVDVMVPPGVAIIGTEVETLVEDVQTLIASVSIPRNVTQSDYNPFYSKFNELDEIEAYIDTLVAKYSSIATPFVAGSTVEGREIGGFRVSTGGSGKPTMYSQAIVHAREWLATPTLLFVIEQLMEQYVAGDETIVPLVEAFDFVIVPIVNKDGYLYSWKTNRMWRKNRRLVAPGTYGTDLNRNWGPEDTWCTAGSSTNPNSDTFCGTSVFSEVEAADMADLINSIDNLALAIDWHTYSSLLLSPFQYSYNKPSEPYRSDVLKVGNDICEAINLVHGSRFESIQGVYLYPHSGGMVDYVYLNSAQHKPPLAYTFELRGNSFIVPPEDIILSGEENYAGIVAGLQQTLLQLHH